MKHTASPGDVVLNEYALPCKDLFEKPVERFGHRRKEWRDVGYLPVQALVRNNVAMNPVRLTVPSWSWRWRWPRA